MCILLLVSHRHTDVQISASLYLLAFYSLLLIGQFSIVFGMCLVIEEVVGSDNYDVGYDFC